MVFPTEVSELLVVEVLVVTEDEEIETVEVEEVLLTDVSEHEPFVL